MLHWALAGHTIAVANPCCCHPFLLCPGAVSDADRVCLQSIKFAHAKSAGSRSQVWRGWLGWTRGFAVRRCRRPTACGAVQQQPCRLPAVLSSCHSSCSIAHLQDNLMELRQMSRRYSEDFLEDVRCAALCAARALLPVPCCAWPACCVLHASHPATSSGCPTSLRRGFICCRATWHCPTTLCALGHARCALWLALPLSHRQPPPLRMCFF